jgi:peptide/nickel transport system substrate-binding protein
MGRSLKNLLSSVLVLCLLISQVGLSSIKAHAAGETVLRYGITGMFISFNPLTGYSYTMIRSILYATLFAYNETWGIEPWGAEYAKQIDPLTIEIKLRDDWYWHDGKPVTSYDYKFTWELLLKYPCAQTRFVKAVSSIDIINDKVFRVHLKSPMGGYLPFLTSVCVAVPKHIWEPKGLTNESALTYENIPPIGNGPFKFVEYKPGEYILFEAFDKFFAGKPKIDKLMVVIFSSMDAMVNALRTGGIDVASNVPMSVAIELMKDPNLYVSLAEIPSYRSIYVNQYPGKAGHPALDDLTVRKAIAMCIDKEGISEAIHPGFTVGFTPIPRYWPMFNPEVQNIWPKYDPKAAGDLLESAGYKDTDGDGIREDPKSGKPLRFRYWVYNAYPEELRAAEFIRDSLRQAGMDVEIRGMEAVLWDYVVSKPYDWDLAQWGWTVHDPISCWFPYTSDAIPAGWSSSGYHNPEFDQLYNSLLNATNYNEFLEAQYKLQKHFAENLVEFILYHESYPSVWNVKWTGFSNKPCGVFWYGFNSRTFNDVHLVGVTEVAKGMNWNLVVGVIAGAIIVIAVIATILIRRKGKRAQPTAT